MKNTKLMLAIIGTFLLTWILLASIAAYLSGDCFRNSFTGMGVMLMMFLFGWIPAVVVGIDLDEKL